MKKAVIYTCVTGGYDPIITPSAVSEYFDYVFFSDRPETDGVWDVRPVGHFEEDGHFTNRWYKMHAAELFPEYEYSVWLDGNIGIRGHDFYERILALMNENVPFAGICHPDRDDIYEEAGRILANRRDSFSNLARAVSFLRRQKFPRHWGLLEANVILRKHSDGNVAGTDLMWWDMVNRYSRRDQMSQTYCLWKRGIPVAYILPPGQNARNSRCLEYVRHGEVYIKDRSLRGKLRDAGTAVSTLAFRAYLLMLGIR